ncbi:hypothetical protein MKX08_007839 [Trichoderma sp. CBMAI-0020]|nr:hypothetical protein MKX08_007839 [Trichoderma sp. CBMAI-0020]
MDLPPPGSPVEDNLKPDLPYVAGAKLKIHEFRPHLPFGISFQDETSRTYHWNPMEKWETASEFCIQNPPLEGQPMANPRTRTIIIDSKLACGHGRGSQLVKCRFEDANTPLVAKIYDPLYYPWPSMLDPTHEADEHFTTEATVYMTLQDMHKNNSFGYPRVRDHLKGSIPQYYGSYTWETQLLDRRRRDVRLILMEYIPFPSIWAILKKKRAESIPAKTRMQLLERVFEVNDFAARNIIVDPDQGRVVLVDFGIAKIRDLYNSEWFTYPGKPLPALPESPIENWGCEWGDEIESWVPKEYRTVRARYDWFMNVWGNSREFRPLGVWWKRRQPHLLKAIAKEEEENQMRGK